MNGQSRDAGWDDLGRELDAWQAQGLQATLWWRDDDATEVTDALERMLDISESTGTPLALAVIPARAGEDLKDRIAGLKQVSVLQHGFAHLNHEPVGTRKSEFGASRDAGQVASELRQGRDLLSDWEALLPVFVPPWNRMDEGLLTEFPKLGFMGISRFKARQARCPLPGMLAVNTHADIIKSGDGHRYFIGINLVLRALIAHLSQRRQGQVDREEPTGILTHHLDHDEESWTFMEQVIKTVGNHPAGHWLNATQVFNPDTVPMDRI